MAVRMDDNLSMSSTKRQLFGVLLRRRDDVMVECGKDPHWLGTEPLLSNRAYIG